MLSVLKRAGKKSITPGVSESDAKVWVFGVSGCIGKCIGKHFTW